MPGLRSRPRWWRLAAGRRQGEWNVGAAGGVAGGLAPLVIIRSGTKGPHKSRQRGEYQPFILFIQILTVVMLETIIRGSGIPSWLDPGAIAFVPAVLTGTVPGFSFFS